MPVSIDAALEDESPRAAPAENKSMMTAYQTLARSLSATPRPASDPKALFSLPQ
jgi:hypothetical protein